VTCEPLLDLLRLLKERDYDFTAVTPATHARVVARPCERPTTRDIFGWNRSFEPADLAPELLKCLEHSGTLEQCDGRLRSKVRVARLGGDLFLHSSFPTIDSDAVFFGPDTYRFARFVTDSIVHMELDPASVVDMGAGSAAGAVAAARMLPSARLTCVDVNPRALELAAINLRAAGIEAELVCSSKLPDGADLVIANPPYMMDSEQRAYRDGGGLLGGEVALDWARNALSAMSATGTMLLYSGASVVDGVAPLIGALQRACTSARSQFDFEEIDPDVFGEELDQRAYGAVERIEVIGATIRRA